MDIIGIVREADDRVTEFMSKSGKTLQKRELVVVDDSGADVQYIHIY